MDFEIKTTDSMEFEMRNISDFCFAEYPFLPILTESKLRGGIIETETQAGFHIRALPLEQMSF